MYVIFNITHTIKLGGVMFVEATSIKNQKTKEIILFACSFVIVPIVSILVICSGKESALYNSLSRIAWPENLLWLVLLWGAIDFGCFFFATKMTVDSAEYTKKWKNIFYAMTAVSCVLLIVGISIPAYNEPDSYIQMLRSVHTGFATVGMVGFLFVLITMTITLYKRNIRQFYLSLGLLCFLIISGVFALVKVSDPSSYCHVSAPAQIYIFSMYNIAMTINYFTMTLLKRE